MAVISILSLWIPVTAATIVYFIGLAIYRLYFHPLAKYPGPFWAKLTQWPEARSSWRGRRHIDLYAMHEKYGDVVRVTPDTLAFRTPGAVQDIYTDRRANMIKTGFTETSMKINVGAITTQIMSDRTIHAARRRLLNQAFSDNALKSMEEYMLQTIRVWCNYLSETQKSENELGDEKAVAGTWLKERNFGVWATLLTLDVLGELCFGASFGNMQAGYSSISELMLSGTAMQTTLAALPFRELIYPLFKMPRFMKAVGGKTVRQKIQYREQMGVLVKKRFAMEQSNAEKPSEEQRKDFFHYLLNAKDPETGDKFLPQDLVGEAALLVAAGSDTSSVTMSACLFYLTRNERVYKKLQQEIRSAFDDVEDIRYGTKLAGLPYLRACIDETLRMTPPVPGMLNRLVLAGGATIDGNYYPAGTVVGVGAYSLHHNENLFPDSFSYIPERWIVGSSDNDPKVPITVTQESVDLAKSGFWAFSSGPRGCVGKNMAYMELSVAIGRLIWLFDVKLKDGDTTGAGGIGRGEGREREGEYQVIDRFICERDGPVLQFRRREVDSLGE